jgi:hypothetical protein
LDFSSGKPFDDYHRSTTLGTTPETVRASSADVNHHALAIDIADLQVGYLSTAQTGSVERHGAERDGRESQQHR